MQKLSRLFRRDVTAAVRPYTGALLGDTPPPCPHSCAPMCVPVEEFVFGFLLGRRWSWDLVLVAGCWARATRRAIILSRAAFCRIVHLSVLRGRGPYLRFCV